MNKKDLNQMEKIRHPHKYIINGLKRVFQLVKAAMK